jgi:hypothetical protein
MMSTKILKSLTLLLAQSHGLSWFARSNCHRVERRIEVQLARARPQNPRRKNSGCLQNSNGLVLMTKASQPPTFAIHDDNWSGSSLTRRPNHPQRHHQCLRESIDARIPQRCPLCARSPLEACCDSYGTSPRGPLQLMAQKR